MRKHLIRAFLVLAFIASNHIFDGGIFDMLQMVGPAAAQQNTLTQTTLTANVPATEGTLFSSRTTFIQVAATSPASSITLNPTQTLNLQNQWIAYIDREAMAIVTVSGLQLTVQRGFAGTVAAPHASGAMVLIGRNSWFYSQDPGGNARNGSGVSNLLCTAANQIVTPYVNVVTGAQWLCSTITLTYVPSFNNPLAPGSAGQTATVPAAAGAVLPTGPLFVISGAGAITGFTVPVGCNATAVGNCSFTVISAAGSTWTWTAAGNIMTAGTGTAGHSFVFTWSASLSKFVPSALS